MHAQKDVLHSHRAPYLPGLFRYDGAGSQIIPLLEIDPYRKGAHCDGAAVVVNGGTLPIHRDLQHVLDALKKMVRMEGKMKSDEVATQKTPQDLLAPGENPKHRRGRKGDVPEKADGEIGMISS